MNTIIRHKLRIGALLLTVVAALLGVVVLVNGEALASPGLSPVVAPQAATLPVTTCTAAGPTTRICELWATTGTLTLPGSSVPIWGYSDTAGGAATLPGPALIATQGETVTVVLHNNLTETTALVFPGQAMPQDLIGVVAGSTITYTLSNVQPGTYLYEAGLTFNGHHQVAMGMFGALIVRPATAGQAYNDAASVYDDEALVVLSEIDPAFNSNPLGFDLRNYAPKYWLINGKAYPDTDAIATAAGHKVLLRYVNAGLQHHSMALLGTQQTVLAMDGSPLSYSYRVVAETIAPGQTADVIASVPPATAPAKYALYDGNLLLHNTNAPGVGGMLTFLTASAAGPGTGTGPTTGNVALAPNPTNGAVDVTVTAVVTADTSLVLTNTVAAAEFFIDSPGTSGSGTPMTAVPDGLFDAATESVTGTIPAATLAALPGGSHTIYVHGQDSNLAWGPFATAVLTLDKGGPTIGAVTLTPNPTNGSVDVTVASTITDAAGTVTAAEFFIDSQGANGMGTAMSAVDGLFDAATESVTGTIAMADLAGLPAGNHTIYVHGQNSAGNWGSFNFAVLNLDKAGPATGGLSLTPDPSNGSVDVALKATGDDRATGNSNVTAAEYFIDADGTEVPGTGTPMTVNVAAPVASLNATIPAATVTALAEGTHVVSVHSQDALGNWGPFGTITLMLDKIGPATSGVSAAPNPNNGTLGFNSNTPAVRVTATLTDSASNVKTAEGFIDSVGADGTGFVLVASDGSFNSPSETGYADIPLSTIMQLSEGPHTIYVHGKDAAGNWGATDSTTLVFDKTKPVVSNVDANPNPTNGTADNNTSFTLTAIAADPLAAGVNSNIVAAEWYEGADPGAGMGNPFAIATPAPTINLSTTINFMDLGWARGDHTLYVRAKDAAGNWSTAVSVVVTVVYPDAIFADAFESGNLSAWNGGSTGGGVSVTTASALQGTYGMQAVLAGNTPGYVTDNTPVAEPSYHARFYFNPNSTLTGNNQAYTIFSGLNAAGTSIFQVQYRRQNAQGGTYQVRGSVLRAGGTTNTNWFTISNNAGHAIEIDWASGNPAAFSLYIDGTLQQTLPGLSTGANLLEAVQLGPSAGLTGAASGTMYFDSFVSTRRTVIGP